MITSLLILCAVVGIASPTPSPQASGTPGSIENHPPPNTDTPAASPHASGVSEESREERYYAEQYTYAQKHPVLARIRRYETVINLFFSFCVMMFTGMLTYFTVKLWMSGEQHSERELRAYISFPTVGIHYVGTNQHPVTIIITLKNCGQTPAYKVRDYIRIAVAKVPFDDFPELPESCFGPGSSFIGPGDDGVVNNEFERPLTPDEKAGIMDSTWAIYVDYEVRYIDAFKRNRRSRFRGFYNGNEVPLGRNSSMLPTKHCAHGNDAT